MDGATTAADATSGQTLQPAVDWDKLAYSFRNSSGFADGVHPNIEPNELTVEAFQVFSDQTAPASTLTIGTPKSPAGSTQPFVSTATPFSLSATDSGSGVFSVSYRFFRQGSVAPDFTTIAAASGQFTLAGPDGTYRIETRATDNAGNVEATHVQVVRLDGTAPVVTGEITAPNWGVLLNSPGVTQIEHSAVLTLNFSARDAASGLSSVTPRLDGAIVLAGHGLQSGQTIFLLTELSLGTHTFTVSAADNVQNIRNASVSFEIIATPSSIMNDVSLFRGAGNIRSQSLANSLLTRLNTAAAAIDSGSISAARDSYRAFINQLQTQSGIGVDSTAANIMIADAQYILAHLPPIAPPGTNV